MEFYLKGKRGEVEWGKIFVFARLNVSGNWLISVVVRFVWIVLYEMENVGSPHLPIVKVQGLRMNYRKISIINSHTKERKTTKKNSFNREVVWTPTPTQKENSHNTQKHLHTTHTHNWFHWILLIITLLVNLN